MSSLLDAKQQQHVKLIEIAQFRLAEFRQRLTEGSGDVKAVKSDLEWTRKHMVSITFDISQEFPEEYQQALIRFHNSNHDELSN